MKIIVTKEQIIDGLQKAAAIMPAKTGSASLRSIWLKASSEKGGMISIMATDANIEFTGNYKATVEEEGLVGVQGRTLVDLIRQLPQGEIKLSLDDSGNMIVQQGRRKYTLAVNGPEWFQAFEPFPAEPAPAMWSGDFLLDVLDRVMFCISDNDSDDELSCLYMRKKDAENIEICGLNGHQFALIRCVNADLAAILPDNGMLLQKRYVQDLKKWLGPDELEVSIVPGKRCFFRRLDGAETMSLPLASWEYPDYNSFMAKVVSGEVSTLSIDRKECMDALSRLQIFNTDTDRCTGIQLGSNEISMFVQGQGAGSATEEMEASYNGGLDRIAFPTRDLLDVFSHFTAARINMNFTTTDGPCGVDSKEDVNYIVIVMPMRIDQEEIYDEE